MMAKSDVLQLRLDPFDMRCLRSASAKSGSSLSDFVRRQLEPSIIAEKIASIAGDFGYIVSVRMFGSMARGDFGDASDVDIAVETDGPCRWMGERGMGRFVRKIEDATGRSVEVVNPRYCSPTLAAEIARDGRLVYER